MRVLHVVPSYWPAFRYGGPIRSLHALCVELRRQGLDIRVATTDADGSGDLPVSTTTWSEVDGVPVRYFPRRPRTRYGVSFEMARWLKAEVRSFDLVHVTSLFSFPSLAANRMAGRAGVPCVVSPRGSLLAGALRTKSLKKVLYWSAFERWNLRRAAAIHATSEEEARAILRAIRGARVEVIPNGVRMPQRAPVVERCGHRVVFLGRIHPIKGFDLLVPAAARLTGLVPEAELVVAGPDEDGYRREVELMIERSRPRPRVKWVGPVSEGARDELLAGAAIAVLPSRSENFGQVVVEALAVGTPVVAAQTTPWAVLERTGAGRWLPRDPETWATVLASLLHDAEMRSRMGVAGIELARTFRWEVIAERMRSVYRSILDGRTRVAPPAGGVCPAGERGLDRRSEQ